MASSTTLTLDIVTPDRQLVHDEVDEVELPGVEGYFGVLPGHTPLLAQLAVGQLSYRRGQDRQFMAVEFGFAEVLPDRVTVIAQCAERAEEIDTERAETARKRAEGRLSTPAATIDIERARIALMKSLIRLQVAARARVRG
jgi:F-type H+-transporting ATPase subunit epsilon